MNSFYCRLGLDWKAVSVVHDPLCFDISSTHFYRYPFLRGPMPAPALLGQVEECREEDSLEAIDEDDRK